MDVRKSFCRHLFALQYLCRKIRYISTSIRDDLMKDYYAILQVSPEADAAEIKKSYRRLATQFHPDKSNHPDAVVLFQDINEAYQVLSNRQQRQLYDLRQTYSDLPAEPYTPPPVQRRPPHMYRQKQPVYIDLVPYAFVSRIICGGCLVFCVVLILDYVLPWFKKEEPIIEIKAYSRMERLEITTPNRVFSIPRGVGMSIDIDLSTYNPVVLYQTPILQTLMRVELQGWMIRTDNTIYGSLIFFPAVLLLLSVLGVWLRGNIEMTVNFGIASTIILLVTLSLIFFVFRI